MGLAWELRRAWVWITGLVAVVTLAVLASWRGHAPEYIPTLAGWLVAANWCLRWDQRRLHLAVPSNPMQREAVGVLGAALLMAEQKALRWLGNQQTLPPEVWALVEGVVNGVFVVLVVPYAMQALRLAVSATPLRSSP